VGLIVNNVKMVITASRVIVAILYLQANVWVVILVVLMDNFIMLLQDNAYSAHQYCKIVQTVQMVNNFNKKKNKY